MFKVGDTVSNFSLPITSGEEFDSAHRDAPYVLFFYPRDLTSGCTTEARDFSELYKEFAELGLDVFGLSTDSIASHEKFIAKENLTVPLISDPDQIAANLFGVWVEKSMYGKTFHGIERSTFLIDANAVVRHVWRKVRPKGHAAEVLVTARKIFSS